MKKSVKSDNEDQKSDKDDKQDAEEDKRTIEVEDEDNNSKALFLQRFLAYIIDLFVIATIASLFATPFIDTKKSDELSERSQELVEKYMSEEINANEYAAEFSNINYDLAKNNGILSIISIFLGVSYYVVFQLYNNGQTIGKKVMKIRIVSDQGDLSMNQMIFRSFIANSILLDIISILFLMLASRHIYFACVGLFSFIQYIIIFVSAFMVKFSKNGLAIHDRLLHTKVIRLN